MERPEYGIMTAQHFLYLPFYDEGTDGRAWVLQPVWRLLGGYASNADSDAKVLPYADPKDADGSISVPAGYGNLYYNAQTGEMLQTVTLTQNDRPLPMLAILTWEDVKDRH
ncbi:MAG: hypothetical protein RR301_10535 [Clostridia bacterium]